jgi:hypothetical protein
MRPLERFTRVLALLCLSACTAKGAFQAAAVCLTSDAEISLFMSQIEQIAQEENLRTFDRSDGVAAEYRQLLKDGDTVRRGAIVMLTARGAHEEGFAVADLGDDYQLTIGFSGGDDLPSARRLSGRVLEKLEREWPVVLSRPYEGTTPIPNCGPSPPASSPAA